MIEIEFMEDTTVGAARLPVIELLERPGFINRLCGPDNWNAELVPKGTQVRGRFQGNYFGSAFPGQFIFLSDERDDRGWKVLFVPRQAVKVSMDGSDPILDEVVSPF